MGLSWRGVLFTAVALSIAGSALFVATILVRAFGTNDSIHQYAIIMDAGSSHTDVILYKWYTSKEKQGIIEKVAVCETRGGIDDREEKVDQTVADLIPCFVNVTNKIEFEEARVVPIYLGATAGMRMLNKAKPNIAQLIFLRVENALLKYKEAGKLFDVRKVGMLSDAEEAVSSWIAANFVSDALLNKNKATSGILEQGGASAQIAYEVLGNGISEVEEGFNLTTVQLYGRTYAVRGTSHLCMGADEMLNRYLASLAMVGETDDPCLNEGDKREVSGEKLNTICTVGANGSPTVDITKPYVFKGAWNSDACKQKTMALADFEKCQKTYDICFKPEPIGPPVNATFYAIANYFYSTESLRNNSKSAFTRDEFEAGAQNLCSKSAQQLSEMFSGKGLEFARNYCFHLNFYMAAFEKLYKFSPKSWSNINFVNKVNDRPLGWPLGFALNATSNYIGEPLQIGTPAIGNLALVALIVLSIVLIFAALVLFGLWKSRDYKKYSKTTRDEYSLG